MGDTARPRLPVDLVTGFLGSGKTTLINAVLREPAFAGSLVIVNEFGDVGVDHLLVSGADDQVVLMDSGCLCCAASGSLRDMLIDLFARRGAGRIASFDRIIVETSGLVDPAPLVATLVGDSAVAARCRLAQVLTLVDGVNGLPTLERFEEACRQVAFADRIAISKADVAESAAVAALARRLGGLNAQAVQTRWQRGAPASPLFEAIAPGARRTAAVPRWSRGVFGAADDRAADAPDTDVPGVDAPGAEARGTEASGAAHGDAYARIRSRAWAVSAPVPWERYARWTATMTRQLGRRLLRCKGLIALGDERVPSVIQGVQGYFAPPERLTRWPAGAAAGSLVVIGEGITSDEWAELAGLVQNESAEKRDE